MTAAAIISVGHVGNFEERPAKNRVVGLPRYLAQILNAERAQRCRDH